MYIIQGKSLFCEDKGLIYGWIRFQLLDISLFKTEDILIRMKRMTKIHAFHETLNFLGYLN